MNLEDQVFKGGKKKVDDLNKLAWTFIELMEFWDWIWACLWFFVMFWSLGVKFVFDSVHGDVCIGCFQFLFTNYLGVINKGGWRSLVEFVCKIKQKEKKINK
jgi:hypothetical protein